MQLSRLIKLIKIFILAMITTAWHQPPRQLAHESSKPPSRPAQWYLADDNTVHLCTGKPHKILTPRGIKIAVEGCGVVLQIILKD